MIKVAIADDQELVRSGIRMILEGEPDMRVVGEAADGQQAFDLVAAGTCGRAADGRPDAGRGWHLRHPAHPGPAGPPRVLMLTTFDLDEYVYDALRAGASGFLLKDMPGEEIVIAVRQAARGSDSPAGTLRDPPPGPAVRRQPPGRAHIRGRTEHADPP